MSRDAWFFMVGFRVFDVGLLVLWMIWFFRLRGDESDPPEDEGGGGGGGKPRPGPRLGPGGGGLSLPLGRVPMAGGRQRDGHRTGHHVHDRRPTPRSPLPARVRSPGAPARVTRNS